MHLATGGRVNLTACGCPRANGVFAATAWVFLAVLLGRHHRLPMAEGSCRLSLARHLALQRDGGQFCECQLLAYKLEKHIFVQYHAAQCGKPVVVLGESRRLRGRLRRPAVPHGRTA